MKRTSSYAGDRTFAFEKARYILDGTEKSDEARRKTAERVERTHKTITPERKERQENTMNEKTLAAKHLGEVAKKVDDLKQELYTKLSNAVKNNESVEKALQENKAELDELKVLSVKLSDLSKTISKHSSYAYNDLIMDLAKNVDPNFCAYADLSKNINAVVFTKCVRTMSLETKKTLQSRLEKAGLFAYKRGLNPLMRTALKYFPDYIHLMNVDDACVALALDPSKFKNLSTENKSIMFNSTTYLKRVLTKNNDLLLYLPYDYLDQLAKKDPSYVGRLIANDPNVLNNFYPAFFADHYRDMKYIFADVNKSKFKEVLKDWVWKFPELGTYFNINTNEETFNV